MNTKILKFDRDAGFHFRKYQKQADKGAYIDSLVSLRTALKKDPDNIEYLVSLAELYTELDFFEESNFILFKILKMSSDVYDKCLFSMGCNFFGLRDIEKAKECFQNYLGAYPAGEFVPDVQDFLDIIEYDIYEDSDVPAEVFARADEGKTLLDNGEYAKAIRMLEKIGGTYPELTFVQNNLALAYYCKGDPAKAREISKQVLRIDAGNAHAICNLIFFALSANDQKELAKYRNMLDKIEGKDADEDMKIALTYCELDEDEKAYQKLKSALTEIPYDIHTMFFAAAAAVNTKRYAEAVRMFMDIVKLQPENTIASYYKKALQHALDKKADIRIQYAYQVPQEEIHRRMHYLNRCFQKDTEELRDMWAHEAYFRSILIWGLSIGNAIVKHIILDLISKFNDETAVDFFKESLLRKNKPDEEKNDIFLALKRMGVPQPYVAYMSGKISEVRIGLVDLDEQKVFPSHEKVVDAIIKSAEAVDRKLFVTHALELLGKYMRSFANAPVMRNVNAWAAAFLYAALLENEKQPYPLQSFLETLHVKATSFKRCLHVVQKTLKKG